jgi:hypothetical protein
MCQRFHFTDSAGQLAKVFALEKTEDSQRNQHSLRGWQLKSAGEREFSTTTQIESEQLRGKSESRRKKVETEIDRV